ncbi:MAG: PadR family transcriptional regulator [Vicinamibacterales bacterium]
MERDLLTDLELMVVLAVLRVGECAYGVPVSRTIEETTGRPVALALVYATLDRLETRGLVTSWVGDPTPERGGRAKRYFGVTAKGLKQIRDTQRAFVSMWRGIPALEDATP